MRWAAPAAAPPARVITEEHPRRPMAAATPCLARTPAADTRHPLELNTAIHARARAPAATTTATATATTVTIPTTGITRTTATTRTGPITPTRAMDCPASA